MPAESNKVANKPGNATGVDSRRPHQNLIAKLDLAAQVDAGNRLSGAEVSKIVMDKMESANGLDDLFAAQESGGADDFVGRIILVHEVSFAKSDPEYASQEGSLGYYVSMRGVTSDGEEFTFSTGSTNVVPFMYRADDMGLISEETPLRVKLTKSGRLFKVSRP